MARVRGMLPAGRKYHIVTLGCQMNVRDSETLAGMLTEMGFTEAATREEADLILYNTCCVRENAENKALGNVIWLKELKKDKPELIICVGGCMTQEEGMAESLIRQYPFIDLVFGTHNAYRFPEYLEKVLSDRVQVFEVLDTGGTICEGLPEKRSNPYFGFVNIMYGCNNFCSYCIVPYVRGRERSREMDDILGECKRLRDAGAREIMLLGQNVNSYMGGGAKFAELLYRVDALDIPRVRFMTSHPKDLSDELIAAYGELRHLMPNLHLPVQAGNDEILKRMNRHYDRETYLQKVEYAKKVMPELVLTSDVIVGFPGETEEEFEETISLIERVHYDSLFTFIFSPRTGTPAAKMEDPTPKEEKNCRFDKLCARQNAISEEIHRGYVGKTLRCLVDGKDGDQLTARTEGGRLVRFDGPECLIGSYENLRITGATTWSLTGELAERK